jgi:hypothetical protein
MSALPDGSKLKACTFFAGHQLPLASSLVLVDGSPKHPPVLGVGLILGLLVGTGSII